MTGLFPGVIGTVDETTLVQVAADARPRYSER
jgi:hypothetical protein